MKDRFAVDSSKTVKMAIVFNGKQCWAAEYLTILPSSISGAVFISLNSHGLCCTVFLHSYWILIGLVIKLEPFVPETWESQASTAHDIKKLFFPLHTVEQI